MITHIRLISSVVAGVENSPNYLHMKTNIQKQQERKCTETNTDTATQSGEVYSPETQKSFSVFALQVPQARDIYYIFYYTSNI